MTHTEIAELTDLYVLDALSPDVAAEVEAHLEQCVECRAAVAQGWKVAQLLRVGVPVAEPDSELRQRLMNTVRAEVGRASRSQLRMLDPVPRASRSLSTGVMKWASVAALLPLLLAGWLTYQVTSLQQQLQNVEVALARSNQGSHVLARTGGMVRVEATEMAPAAKGMLYFDSGANQAVLVVEGLPPLPPNEEYRCWLMSGGKPMSGPALSIEDGGRVMAVINSPMPLDSVEMLRVTNEPVGGGAPQGKGYLWARMRGT